MGARHVNTFDQRAWRKDVGQRVQTIRKQRGFSQERLAAEVNVPRAMIASIETGRQGIFADILWRFAIVLNVPVQKLMPERARHHNHSELP